MSSIIIAVDCVHPCSLARPLANSRRALKNIKEYLLGQVKLSQINSIAVYCIRDEINSSCFSTAHKA